VQTTGLSQLHRSSSSVLALPENLSAIASQIKPMIAVAHCNPIFPQLNRGLPVAIQPVRRGVTAEQGS
jgi:hypothetical protein